MQSGGGGRKTWQRGPAPIFKEIEGRNEALSSAGVDPSYREYLAVMQEKNRILKDLRRKDADKQKAIVERERGFELNFAGANEERLKLKEKTSNPKRGVGRDAGLPNERGALGGGRVRGVRSKWMQGSVHIQTERGSVVVLQPPGKNQQRESMQWLMSDEGRGWLEVRQRVIALCARIMRSAHSCIAWLESTDARLNASLLDCL